MDSLTVVDDRKDQLACILPGTLQPSNHSSSRGEQLRAIGHGVSDAHTHFANDEQHPVYGADEQNRFDVPGNCNGHR